MSACGLDSGPNLLLRQTPEVKLIIIASCGEAGVMDGSANHPTVPLQRQRTRMLRAFSDWQSRQRCNRAAVDAAVQHFERTTGQKAHARISSVLAEEAGQFVVRVCYRDVKPPGRVWYRIGENNSVIAELSFEEATRLGECGWR
jgi:hypothetical protein